MRTDQRFEPQPRAEPIEQAETGGREEPDGVESPETRQLLTPVLGEQEGEKESKDRRPGEEHKSPPHGGDRQADDSRRASTFHPVVSRSSDSGYRRGHTCRPVRCKITRRAKLGWR